MKIALSIWKNRISPLFDVARQVLIVDVEQGEILATSQETLPEMPGSRLAVLTGLKVEALVCGAISQPLADMAESSGIQVMPFVAGDVEEVMRACVSGALRQSRFAMPGCRGPNSPFAMACAGRRGGRRFMMPRGDGTGPQGDKTGGQGKGQGRGPGACKRQGGQDSGAKGGQGKTNNPARGNNRQGGRGQGRGGK